MLSDPKEPMKKEELVKLLIEAAVKYNEVNRLYPIEIIFKTLTLQQIMIMKLLHTGQNWTYPTKKVEFLALESMLMAGTNFKNDLTEAFET